MREASTSMHIDCPQGRPPPVSLEGNDGASSTFHPERCERSRAGSWGSHHRPAVPSRSHHLGVTPVSPTRPGSNRAPSFSWVVSEGTSSHTTLKQTKKSSSHSVIPQMSRFQFKIICHTKKQDNGRMPTSTRHKCYSSWTRVLKQTSRKCSTESLWIHEKYNRCLNEERENLNNNNK